MPPDKTDRQLQPSLILAGSGILVLLLLALIFALHTRYTEATIRRNISKVHTDHRTLAVALETYFVDVSQYPMMSMGRDLAYGAHHLPVNVPVSRTFRLGRGSQAMTLTTPISYLTKYPHDPFSTYEGTTYSYFKDRHGWIIGSWGPDRDQATGGDLQWQRGDFAAAQYLQQDDEEQEEWPNDQGWHWRRQPFGDRLPGQGIANVYHSLERQPSELLLGGDHNQYGEGAFTFDPTNGLRSQGDIWRVKQ